MNTMSQEEKTVLHGSHFLRLKCQAAADLIQTLSFYWFSNKNSQNVQRVHQSRHVESDPVPPTSSVENAVKC